MRSRLTFRYTITHNQMHLKVWAFIVHLDILSRGITVFSLYRCYAVTFMHLRRGQTGFS